MSYEVAMTITPSDIKQVIASRSSKVDDAEAALCEALVLIKFGGELNPELVTRIVAVAVKSDLKLIEWVAPIVCALTELYSSARSAICDLSRSKNVIARLCAIYALSPKLDDGFVVNILKKLVYDYKSIKVRTAAIDWIGRHNKKQFSNLLDAALEVERNEKVRKLISSEVALLNFGYVVERNNNGGYITVVGSFGRVSTVVENRDIERLSDSEIFELYLPKIVASRI